MTIPQTKSTRRSRSPRLRKPSEGGGKSAKPKRRTLRDLSKEGLSKEEQLGFGKEVFGTTSDRAAAILAAVQVEVALTTALTTRLRRIDAKTLEMLSRPNGPFGSLFSKIHLGYALGLFKAAIRDDLDNIRQIRNVFAHAQRFVTFETQEISDACSKLIAKVEGAKALEAASKDEYKKIGYAHLSRQRVQYVGATVYISRVLAEYADKTLKRRLRHRLRRTTGGR